jgi:hypothetical protein
MEKETKRLFEYIVENRFPQFFQMLERNLDAKRWGLHQTFSGIAEHFSPSVIYASKACQVRFLWYEPDPRETATVVARYGRLHAPVAERYIRWNGKACYCWHDPRMAYHFLDGLSPQEAVDNRYKWPQALEQVRQVIEAKDYPTAEIQRKLHAASWDIYGDRLFHLFDLNNPESWEQYTLFLKECYKIDAHPDEYGSCLEYEICY